MFASFFDLTHLQYPLLQISKQHAHFNLMPFKIDWKIKTVKFYILAMARKHASVFSWFFSISFPHLLELVSPPGRTATRKCQWNQKLGIWWNYFELQICSPAKHRGQKIKSKKQTLEFEKRVTWAQCSVTQTYKVNPRLYGFVNIIVN